MALEGRWGVRYTVVQALRLCTGRTAHRGSRGIALLLLDHDIRRGWGVRFTLVQTLRLCTSRTAHRWSRGIAILFLDHGTRRGEGSASRPGRSLPPWKNRYPFYRRLVGTQGRSGQVRKILVPTGIRSLDRPVRSSVCIATELSRFIPCANHQKKKKSFRNSATFDWKRCTLYVLVNVFRLHKHVMLFVYFIDLVSITAALKRENLRYFFLNWLYKVLFTFISKNLGHITRKSYRL